MVAPIEVATPEAFGFLYDPPLGELRYRVGYGGRGSAKSWQFARSLLVHGFQNPLRILCAREWQNSLADSVHTLLTEQAEAIGLGDFYSATKTAITGANGTEFIFKGLRRDPKGIKSSEGIDIAWVEEAEAVSRASWNTLIPTVRRPGSEIWVSFNPSDASDPTYQRFVVDPQPRSAVVKVGYRDNPWLPAELLEEANTLRERDPEAYAHVWGGDPISRSDAQVFGGRYLIEDFAPAPHWDGPYYGADWGFSRDPSVLMRLWIADSRLYVEYDEGGVGLDLDQLVTAWQRVPGSSRYQVWADSARPETIHEMGRRGFRVKGAPKWAGSVEDGIEHLRSYQKIVIHPRCKRAQEEARLYRYKVDSRTGEVRPDLVDSHNHTWDAIRYALSSLIRRRGFSQVSVSYA